MKCEEVSKEFAAILDGELEEAEMNVIKEHLRECSSCAQELQLHQKTSNLLRIWEDVEPKPQLASEVMATIDKEVRQYKRPAISIKTIAKSLEAIPSLLLVYQR